MQHYDVIIVGGGIVGSTLACILLQHGMKIAVIEAQTPIAETAKNIDLRVYALTRASEQIFRYIHAWQNMEKQRVSPFQQMHVWDAEGLGEIHFDSAEIMQPTLGYIVEQNVIQTGLAQCLDEFKNLTVYQPAQVQKFEVTDTSVTVTLNDQQTLTSQLLVGAEGANSPIRTLAGINYHLYDYAQQAVVATVTTEYSHQATAWQRFLPTGPLAFLPLSNEYQCSIVWSADTVVAQRLANLEKIEFQQALGEAFAFKLGDITDISVRNIFPLKRRHAFHYVKPRIAIIGDAAHTIHPLAGQGVNLGLLDAATLGEVVVDTYNQQLDVGHYKYLRRYERQRKGNNLVTMAAMDGFKYLFGQRPPSLTWLRNVGMALTNQLPPIKRHLIEQAMGLTGNLPRIASPSIYPQTNNKHR